MNWKNGVETIILIGCVGILFECGVRAGWNRSHPSKAQNGSFTKVVSGFRVRLVAVADTDLSGQARLADHSWTPDGSPYEGAEARLTPRSQAISPKGGTRRTLVFETEQVKADGNVGSSTLRPLDNLDFFAFLPDSSHEDGDSGNPGAAGPIPVQIWQGTPRDSAGNVVLTQPASVQMRLGVQSTDPQPVVIGVADGVFKVIANGPASVAGLDENQTEIVASGPWGRLEATRLPRPMFETKPSPTHRFRLLGGPFPPAAERNALFYDSRGTLVASCSDGPNNAGYAGGMLSIRGGVSDLSRFEVRERPYKFVRFDGVSFDAPSVKAYDGQKGLDHAESCAIGKVLGVLKPTKDGPWMGYTLYAADGTRWRDPGQDIAGYEYGSFDSWNHPLDERLDLLFAPESEFIAANTPTTCEVYASDSREGTRKEKLTSWSEMSFRGPMTSIPCKPTTRPYMRVEIRVGVGAWKTLETVAVADRVRNLAKGGAPGSNIVEVAIYDDGAIRIRKGEEKALETHAKWHPGEQRIRSIAHLIDGTIADVDFNMGGFGGAPPNERRYHGLELSWQANGAHVQSGFKRIDMMDIVSFELQVQDLRPALVIPIHSPTE